MTRSRSMSRNKLVESSTYIFWERGFHATSINDLVQATDVGRGGIYSDFGGKEQLFHACLSFYRERFADPAIALLRAEPDGFAAIESYFSYFIALHERRGLPGPGCFIANAMTEVAQHDQATFKFVEQHSEDLRAAFSAALVKAILAGDGELDDEHREKVAQFLVTSSQGLWSHARNVEHISILKDYVSVLTDLLRSGLSLVSKRAEI